MIARAEGTKHGPPRACRRSALIFASLSIVTAAAAIERFFSVYSEEDLLRAFDLSNPAGILVIAGFGVPIAVALMGAAVIALVLRARKRPLAFVLIFALILEAPALLGSTTMAFLMGLADERLSRHEVLSVVPLVLGPILAGAAAIAGALVTGASQAAREALIGAIRVELLAAGPQASASEAWRRLERAHILSQPMALEHARVHLRMLVCALRERRWREVSGQISRLLLAAPSSVFDLAPRGNVGSGQVGMFVMMPVPSDLRETLAPFQGQTDGQGASDVDVE